MSPEYLQLMAIRIPGVLLALSIHEAAHAWVADRCGDPTARLAGRVSLNPLVHLDPMGTLCMIWARFGWAKPVPVNPYNLHNPKRDDMLVSAAGPVSNFLLAVAFGIVFRICFMVFGVDAFSPDRAFMPWLVCQMALEGVYVSCALGVFNLIPLFPLDGSHVLKGFLPNDLADRYERLNPIMPIILLVVIFAFGRELWQVIGPPIRFLVSMCTGIPSSYL